jgi:phosphatidylglycerol:prolipoprotein diacylglycerol transferase
MDTFIQINTEAGQFYYSLFYRLSFLIGFLLYLVIGIRRKYPLHSWLLLGAIATLFFIIGTKVGTYSWQEWTLLFKTGHFPLTSSKSLIGGFILGLVAIAFFRKWMNFKPSLLDAYALILPATLILQRVGCLLAGCCFGTPTDAPWSIQYASHYSIAIHHMEEGFIGPFAGSSMAVHPVPIYLMITYLGVLWLSWKKRNSWIYKGSLAIFTLICLLSFRFIVEFFRDSATNHALGETLFGLKEIQWLLLGITVILLLILTLREKFGWLTQVSTINHSEDLQIHALLTTMLVVIVWIGSSWFTPSEAIIIHCYVGLILLSFAILLWDRRRQLQPQLSVLTLFILTLFFINQTYDDDKLNFDNNSNNETHTITIGIRQADLDLTFIEKEYNEDGCDQVVVRSDTIQTQSAISGSLLYTHEFKKTDRKSTVLGVGGSYSQLELLRNNRNENIVSSGAIFFFGNEWKNTGLKIGLGIGSFTTISNESTKDLSDVRKVLSRKRSSHLFPSLGLRIGERDKVYLFGTVGLDYPYDPLYSRYKIGIGIGAGLFDLRNKSKLELGIAQGIDRPLFHLGADIALNKHFVLQPALRLGEYPVYGIGLSYQFIKN